MIRKMAPINLIMHRPKTDTGKADLAARVAEVHANAVTRRLKELNCPAKQKLELLDAVIKGAAEGPSAEDEQKPPW